MSFIDIDEAHLDNEWFDHPSLVEEWGHKKADADHAAKQAEDRLSLVKAEVRLRVRKYPSKYGLMEKATTDDVEAAVTCSQRFQEAQAELRSAQAESFHMKAAMEALDHRRTAMSKAVELWQMGFRSQPRIKGEPSANGRRTRKGLKKRRATQ